MTETIDRLSRGAQLLADANGDPDLIGVALLAFQGALDLRLRELLATHPNLTEPDRTALADLATPPDTLVELARRYGDLSREQAWRITEIERLRIEFARGGPFRGSPAEVRAYARFIAELCGQDLMSEQLAGMTTAQLAAPKDAEFDDLEEAPAPAGIYDTVMRWLPGLALIALLITGGWALLSRAAGREIDSTTQPPVQASIATVAPTTRPDATFAPIIIAQVTPSDPATATPAARRGRIVRLGGGPGWLHESASFDSPTRPIRLSEGQAVALLGPQQNDSQGTVWAYVAVGGYEGWSPLNNVEEIR
jgi:hypothetical protein